MSKIGVDTNLIKISGENIKKYASEYNQVVENIFSTIQNLELNGAWVGDGENSSVRKYIGIISKEKQNYTDFAISVNNLGNAIIGYAEDINSISNENV